MGALPQCTPLHISSSPCDETEADPGAGGREVDVQGQSLGALGSNSEYLADGWWPLSGESWQSGAGRSLCSVGQMPIQPGAKAQTWCQDRKLLAFVYLPRHLSTSHRECPQANGLVFEQEGHNHTLLWQVRRAVLEFIRELLRTELQNCWIWDMMGYIFTSFSQTSGRLVRAEQNTQGFDHCLDSSETSCRVLGHGELHTAGPWALPLPLQWPPNGRSS